MLSLSWQPIRVIPTGRLQLSRARVTPASGDEGEDLQNLGTRPEQLVIERIRAKCEEPDERYLGYRKDLLSYLAEILQY